MYIYIYIYIYFFSCGYIIYAKLERIGRTTNITVLLHFPTQLFATLPIQLTVISYANSVLLNMLQMDGQYSVWGDAHSTSFSVLRRASHEGTVWDKHFPPGRNDHFVQHAHQSNRAHVSLWVLPANYLWHCPLVHSANTNHNIPQLSVFVQDICRLFRWCLLFVNTEQRMKFCIQIWNRHYLERLFVIILSYLTLFILYSHRLTADKDISTYTIRSSQDAVASTWLVVPRMWRYANDCS